MTWRVILSVAVSMLLAGCLAGEMDLAAESEADYDVTASELHDEEAQGLDAVDQESFEAPAEEAAAVEPLCEPGPPSNWCQNVHGTACTSTTFRRCYLPNYCEWMICQCEGGAWNCWL